MNRLVRLLRLGSGISMLLAAGGCPGDPPGSGTDSGSSGSTTLPGTTEGSTDVGDSTGTPGTTTATTAEPTTGEPTTGEPTTGEPTTGEPTTTGTALCEGEIDALAPDVTQEDGGCSVVVRLDHDTLDLIGYHAICSPYVDTFLDETGARAMTFCCTAGGTRLNPPEDENLWVFYQAPGDFGAAAVVTNHIVEHLFEGTIIWDGAGDIQHPVAWQDPDALASDCSGAEMPSMATYDLVEGGTEIDNETVEAIWDVVGTTALPHAMATLGTVLRGAILRYPRSVGAFDPTSAEYIVILEGGV